MMSEIKCIYCGATKDLTDSDIIPYGLTGAKLHKRFVCHKHNSFTNDNYEEQWINSLSFFRNCLGFSTRAGGPITYKATVTIGDAKIEDNKFSNISAMLANKKRLYPTNNGELLGNIETISAIAEKHGGKISSVDLSSVTTQTSLNSTAFTSSSVLHAIAKIGYESHCYFNNVNDFCKEIYGTIVDYIIDPNNNSCMVEMVTDIKIYDLFNQSAIYGTNIIFEYDDNDGYRYVIFSLWYILFYKIKICRTESAESNKPCDIYLFHPDGSRSTAVGTVEMVNLIRDMESKKALDALCNIYPIIVKRLECLYQPYFTYESLLRQRKRFEKDMVKLKNGELSIAEFLKVGDVATISYVYMFEFLLKNKKYYNNKISFPNNLILLVRSKKIVLPDMNGLKNRYINMFENGDFIPMLDEAFAFFNSITA